MSTQVFGVPDTWFVYEWPPKTHSNAPVPSQANYDPTNVAWISEVIGSTIGTHPSNLILQYDNNTPDNPGNRIYINYPNDGINYWANWAEMHQEGTDDQARYEFYAKNSARLKLFQDTSPAKIEYFQPLS